MVVRHGVTEFLDHLESVYATFFDLENDFLVVLDKAGNVKRVNLSFRRQLGYANVDVIGQGFMRLIRVDDWAQFIRTFASPHPAPVRMLRKEQGEVAVRLAAWRFSRGFSYLVLRPIARSAVDTPKH